MFTDEQKSRFLERGKNVTTSTLTDASHDAHLDAFDEWIEVLTRFLNEH